MLTFEKYLKELSFTYPQKISTRSLNGKYIGRFNVKSIEYIIEADEILNDKWDIEFKTIIGNDYSLQNYQDMDLTLQVFGAVKQFIMEFVKDKKPYQFTFLAKEPSRKRLYAKFSNELTRIIPYKQIETKTLGQDLMFWFERI